MRFRKNCAETGNVRKKNRRKCGGAHIGDKKIDVAEEGEVWEALLT